MILKKDKRMKGIKREKERKKDRKKTKEKALEELEKEGKGREFMETKEEILTELSRNERSEEKK